VFDVQALTEIHDARDVKFIFALTATGAKLSQEIIVELAGTDR
jgi:Holliday junction resolvasome RuvABC DNA-binding subunit